MNRRGSGLGHLPESIMHERRPGRQIFDPTGNGDPSQSLRSIPYVLKSAIYPFNVPLAGLRVAIANPLRRYLLVQNRGATQVYFNLGSNATAANGIEIIAGGNYEFIGARGNYGGYCPLEDVYVAGSAGNELVIIVEGLEVAAY